MIQIDSQLTLWFIFFSEIWISDILYLLIIVYLKQFISGCKIFVAFAVF